MGKENKMYALKDTLSSIVQSQASSCYRFSLSLEYIVNILLAVDNTRPHVGFGLLFAEGLRRLIERLFL